MLPPILGPLQASLHRLDEELAERRKAEVPARQTTSGGFAFNDDDDEVYVPAVDAHELSDKLGRIWSDLTAQNPPLPAAADDRLRQILDLVIREMVLEAAQQVSFAASSSSDDDGEGIWLAQSRLRDVLDICLCLLEAISTSLDVNVAAVVDANGAGPSQPSPRPTLDPGQVLMPILDDLLDVLAVDSWIRFFGWMETRAERLTRGMEPSRGKALPLLKLLNSLLRITPKTSSHPDQLCLEFRARVQLFAAKEIPLFDQSGVNPRGEYATDLGDNMVDEDELEEEVERTEGELVESNGMDVDQQEEEGAVASEEPSASDRKKELRRSLRSVHQACANPTSIASPSGLEGFKRDAQIVVSAMIKAKGATTVARDARYFVGPNIDADLQDLGYRKQLSIQLLILLRSLQNLTPATRSKTPTNLIFPATFAVSPEDAQWAADRSAELLSGDSTLSGFVSRLLRQEHTYELWKHLKCFNWTKPSVSHEVLKAADENRKRLTAPLRPYVFSAGTRALSTLARNPLTSVEQLKNFQLDESIESLKAKYDAQALDEEDDRAMGKETPQSAAMHVENKASLSWRAMRIAVHEDIGILPDVLRGDLPTLVQAREKRKQRQESAPEEETAGATPVANEDEEADPNDAEGATDADKAVDDVEEEPAAKAQQDVEMHQDDDAQQGTEAPLEAESQEEDVNAPREQNAPLTNGEDHHSPMEESGAVETPTAASAKPSPKLVANTVGGSSPTPAETAADVDMQAAEAIRESDATPSALAVTDVDIQVADAAGEQAAPRSEARTREMSADRKTAVDSDAAHVVSNQGAGDQAAEPASSSQLRSSGDADLSSDADIAQRGGGGGIEATPAEQENPEENNPSSNVGVVQTFASKGRESDQPVGAEDGGTSREREDVDMA